MSDGGLGEFVDAPIRRYVDQSRADAIAPIRRQKPLGASPRDELSAYSPKEVADWYRRLADLVSRKIPNSLAAQMLLHWLDGHGLKLVYDPSRVKNLSYVVDKLRDEVRPVFLTDAKARRRGGSSVWGGILPRILGLSPYGPWDGKSKFQISYEGSAVELPLSIVLKAQAGYANADELDLFMSLHGFTLHTDVVMSATAVSGSSKYAVKFESWQTKALDRYHWNPDKYLPMPNPDFGNPLNLSDPIAPQTDQLLVYHSNAIRVEKAGLAAPYDDESQHWVVTDPGISGDAQVDGARKL